MKYDIIIIGAGPAGASAAMFTAKAGKKTLLIDNDRGMTRRALFANYYAVKEITGPEMVDTGIEQAKDLGATYIKDTAMKVSKADDGIVVETENDTYNGTHVILATGAAVTLAENSGIEVIDGKEPRIKKVVKVDAEGKTNVENIWAAGTCAGVSVHAIITAGDGAKVAINIISELNGERYVDHDILEK